MKYALTANRRPPLPAHARRARGRAAFTFTELLVAMAIALIFLSSVYVTYMQIRRMHQLTETRIDAYRNARTALTSLSDEFKELNRLGNDFLLVGLSAELGAGDRKDNDLDGDVDEESLNGFDDDATSASNVIFDDRHAFIGRYRERPLKIGIRDLGDENVDEDVKFSRDACIFRIFPQTPTADFELKTVTYAVTDFDGRQNVLVRQTRIERAGEPPLIGLAPIAFNVLSFDLLYWDPNNTPEQQNWVETWDSSDVANFNLPRLPLPASVYIRVTVRADRRPDEAIAATEPIETVKLETVVNVEQIIGDVLFPRPLL